MGTVQHSDRCVISVTRRTTGLRCAGHGKTPQLAALLPHTSNRDKEGHRATSTISKAPWNEKVAVLEKRKALCLSKEVATTNIDSLSGPSHHPKEKYSLQTDTGKVCSNLFECFALGDGNPELK